MRHLFAIGLALFMASSALAQGNFDNPYTTNGVRPGGPPPSIPEPGAIALFAAGAGVVAWRIARNRDK